MRALSHRHPALESDARFQMVPGAKAILGCDIPRGGKLLKDQLGEYYDRIPDAYKPGLESLGRAGLSQAGFGGKLLKDEMMDAYGRIPDSYKPGLESLGRAGLSQAGFGGKLLRESMLDAYNRIPEAYHPGIESLGRAAMAQMGFGLRDHVQSIKQKMHEAYQSIPKEFHPHIERLARHALHEARERGLKQLDATMGEGFDVHDMMINRGAPVLDSNGEAPMSVDYLRKHLTGGNVVDDWLSDFGRPGGNGEKVMNFLKPSYADAPGFAQVGEAMGKLGGGLKMKKGSPEMKAHMARLRSMRKMKGGDLPPRSRSYVTDASLM